MAQHNELTGSDLHEPKGAATASAGQVYVADGLGSGNWENPLTDINNLNEFEMNGTLEDVSETTSFYVRVARDCSLTDVYIVESGAITGSDAELTIYRDGISLAQTISIPVAGSGEGVKITANLDPVYSFTEGQVLKLTSNGASTDAMKLHITCKFTAA